MHSQNEIISLLEQMYNKEKHIHFSVTEDVLQESVLELSLSVREYNALVRCNIATIGDLLNCLKHDDNMFHITEISKELSSQIVYQLFSYLFAKS